MFDLRQQKIEYFRIAYLALICSLMLGPTATYIAFGAIVIIESTLVRGSSFRSDFLSLFATTRWFWSILAAFCLIFSATVFFGGYADFGEVGELKWVIILIGLFFPSCTILAIPPKGRGEKTMAKVFLGLLVISVVAGAMQVSLKYDYVRLLLFSDNSTMGGRASGILSNPIPFGQLMGAIFFIGLAGYLVLGKHISRRISYFLLSVLVLSFLGLILSESRGAWLALVLTSFFSFFYTESKARKRWMKWILLIGSIGVLAIVVFPEIRSRVVSGFDSSESSNRVRLELWRANWEALKEHPLGVGYGGGDVLVEEVFPKLGYQLHGYMWHSHNEFIEIAVGAGWAGLILYLLMSALLLIVGIKEYYKFLRKGDEWKAFLSMSAVMIHTFIQFCALTDQTNTQGRFLLCMAWAMALSSFALNRITLAFFVTIQVKKVKKTLVL